MNIPKTKTVNICEAERFAIGLRELCQECNVKSWSALQTFFHDGSYVGNKVLYEYALGISDNL